MPLFALTAYGLDQAEGPFEFFRQRRSRPLVVRISTALPLISSATCALIPCPSSAATNSAASKTLVSTHHRSRLAHAAVDRPDGRHPLYAPHSPRALDIDYQPIAVLGEYVCKAAQLGLRELALLLQRRPRVGRSLVRGVAAHFALEVLRLGVAPGRLIRTTAVLGRVADPRLDRRTIDAEVVVGHEALPLDQMQYATEEPAVITPSSVSKTRQESSGT